MIKKFKNLRSIPQFGMSLYVVFLENGRSFYCLCPDDVIINDDNVKDYRISNTLYEYLLFVDFPDNGR